MTRVLTLLRDPLCHFLIIGVVGYAVLAWAGDREDTTVISVDRAALAQFVQFRSRAFDADFAAAQIDGLKPEELRNLIDQYTREEILYREAKALGLDEGDFIIRQRLLGKMVYLTEGRQTGVEPTDAQLAAFLAANEADYRKDPAATVAQVFLNAKGRNPQALAQAAERLLQDLQRRNVPPEDSARFGDPVPLSRNLVDSPPRLVTAELGEEASRGIFAQGSPEGRWIGPYYSPEGARLVFIVDRQAGGVGKLEDIRAEVERDFLAENRAELGEAVEEEIARNYDVRIATDLKAALGREGD